MRTSTSNQMTVVFYSDASYVDRGFNATFIAFEPSNRKCLVSESARNLQSKSNYNQQNLLL